MAVQIKNRTFPGETTRDPSSIDNLTYNERSGARKSTEVGRALLPLNNGAGGFTTNAATIRILPSPGKNLAIYNSDTSVHAITVGDSTMTAQAAGTVQTGATAPFVGVPCAPGAWTYLAAGQWNYVGADSATLYVFLIDDNSFIVVQPATNAST